MNALSSSLRVTVFCVVLLVFSAGMSACQKQAAKESATAGVPEAPKAAAATESFKVTVAQVQKWIEAGETIVVLDSRSRNSWNSSTTKASGAIRVPPDNVGGYLDKIPRDTRIVVYCT